MKAKWEKEGITYKGWEIDGVRYIKEDDLLSLLEKERKRWVEEMPEGFVIWKYNGRIFGGQAKYMSEVYVDDYPYPHTSGVKRIVNLIEKLNSLEEKK